MQRLHGEGHEQTEHDAHPEGRREPRGHQKGKQKKNTQRDAAALAGAAPVDVASRGSSTLGDFTERRGRRHLTRMRRLSGFHEGHPIHWPAMNVPRRALAQMYLKVTARQTRSFAPTSLSVSVLVMADVLWEKRGRRCRARHFESPWRLETRSAVTSPVYSLKRLPIVNPIRTCAAWPSSGGRVHGGPETLLLRPLAARFDRAAPSRRAPARFRSVPARHAKRDLGATDRLVVVELARVGQNAERHDGERRRIAPRPFPSRARARAARRVPQHRRSASIHRHKPRWRRTPWAPRPSR